MTVSSSLSYVNYFPMAPSAAQSALAIFLVNSWNHNQLTNIMKCCHCNYETGYDSDYNKVDGGLGDFWYPDVKMRRKEMPDYYDDGEREAYIVGCPKCKLVFIHEP